jgi:hypothetical protein
MPKYDSTIFTVTKTEPSKHEIFPDGTYSNAGSVVVPPKDAKPQVELGALAIFGGPYAKSGYVYQIEETGFWTRPDLNYAPDLAFCNFWTWDYAKQHMKGGV